ncbi:MAG: hypothetical protein ACLFVO_25695 [Chloroflexaceae bacterium]
MQIRGKLAGCLILPFIALVFGAVAGGLILVGRNAAREAARVAQLSPLSATVLEDSPPGRAALIEGRISERNQQRLREFVVYVREEYRGSDDDGDPKWSEDERVTPPLLIELADGRVQIENADYRLERAPVTWQEDTALRWNGISGEGTKRYTGFVAGDPVTAMGTVVQGREGRALNAERLYGGSRADYIAEKESDAAILPWIGGSLGLVSAILLGVWVWLLLRR